TNSFLHFLEYLTKETFRLGEWFDVYRVSLFCVYLSKFTIGIHLRGTNVKFAISFVKLKSSCSALQ
ncbi:hypothetical protein LKD73_17535, partial [Fusicatenibacter sp. CLA-AA-H241]|nr:hypothetical protein [Oliverpabstia intestinalis]